ncbi:TonB-dependent receptor plug domain-containing protein [Leptospira sp. GIMC2001]|uniref:TonB-dependent receptor plug domain-containing protein n=1 Tax=Leptospira sp. GIMC2001 TaxID=1513297 RepID=UPI002349D20E|nr:TonB-dependent receptor [Leptospira sp. GIMC2001]WCL49450.1 TonB-dependent receptor [Leptospira sp. GIMC2001]
MKKVSFIIKFFFILTILKSGFLFAQDKKQTFVIISDFELLNNAVPADSNTKIAQSLKSKLEAKNYRVELINGSKIQTNIDVSKSKGADFYIGGFLKYDKTLEIYGQVFDPEKGYAIDALNTSGSIEGLESVDINLDDVKKSDSEIVNEFTNKMVLRLRSNLNKSVRNQNLQEFVTNSKLASNLDIPVPKEDLQSQSKEVFQLMASQEVTVASNVIKDSDKQPVSVSVITRKQIQMSGARTLNHVLTTYVPGFFTVEDQDDTIAGFRGLVPDANSKTLLLVNGHNLNTEWQFGPPDSIINSINLDFIERIEVIRGPGSVTLGQGALLGVINIITRTGVSYQGTSIQGGAGENGFRNMNIQSGSNGKYVQDLKTYFYVSKSQYRGQKIRSEGFARSQNYQGVDIQNYELLTDPVEIDQLSPEEFGPLNIYPNIASSSGNRLNRSRNEIIIGNVEYKGLKIDGLIANQTRDIYNFYRDRNEAIANVSSLGVTYDYPITENINLKTKGFYTQDDFGFKSHNGVTLGGVRENRYGGSAIFNLSPFRDNQLAVGAEYRKYDMGQRDANRNNFIVNRSDAESFFPNVTDPTLPPNTTVNDTNIFVNPSTIEVASVFAEDFHKLTNSIDVFGAFRYDKHPFWGSNVSPRVGILYEAVRDLRFRLSYQEGFRGAVGVANVGGYRRDGLLRTANFNQVELAQIPTVDSAGNPTNYTNIPETRPEKMRSYEFGTKYRLNNWSFDGVLFYNQVENIIDVGVIFPEPFGNGAPELGDDIPGDWGGYFFFRNAPGILKQSGGEFKLSYNSKLFGIDLSHSVVRVISADRELFGSVYLIPDSANKRHRAYPENVSRANFMVFPTNKLSLSLNYVHYYDWYSPAGQRLIGTGIMNSGIAYEFTENMELIFSAMNLLNSNALYPLNNNAGDVVRGAGSPALEGRTYWVNFRYTF